VVYYRITLMSKDGDWIVREDEQACTRILTVLQLRGARYRPAAPLDVRWLSGGWSSHLEFLDERRRRIRCDFLSRPPRVSHEAVVSLFEGPGCENPLLVVDVDSLARMKQTQRAKDYPVIGELTRLLPPAQEIGLTTDPDRILQLADAYGRATSRESVRAAASGKGREAVVVALAMEIDRLQRQDRDRVTIYMEAARPYLDAVRSEGLTELPLMEAHGRAVELADRLLPRSPLRNGTAHADAE
jgi:hypothetical protein